jgi:HEPN domain-containing protein
MNEIPKPVDFQISDADLHVTLVEIDEQLRASNSKLFGRELRGWGLFCQKFNLTMAMNDPLAVRIFDWFDRQYGDRLKGDLDFGKTVAKVRHDFYSVRLPNLYGTAFVHCDPMLLGYNFGPELTVNSGGVKMNLFNYLQGVTPDFIQSLSDQEYIELLEVYRRGVVGYSRLCDCQGAPYSKEALDDLHQSSRQLTDNNPNYGFSRWASLQAVEKLLKSFIEQQGKTFKKIHELEDLAKVAVSAGLPPPDAQLLAKIQCKADVRYSAATVGKAEALEAHYAALAVCADVAPRLRPQSGWRTHTRMASYLVDGKPRPMAALVVSRLKAE